MGFLLHKQSSDYLDKVLILKNIKPYFKQYSLIQKTKFPPVTLKQHPIEPVPLLSFKVKPKVDEEK
jgi:hypothetical protein